MENIKGRTEAALRYQEQITGLPRGLDVKLPNPDGSAFVSFDGCRESDGTMLEAKGPNYASKLQQNSPYVWPNIEAWHFAEKEVADYFRPRWKCYPNVTVIYTPPTKNP